MGLEGKSVIVTGAARGIGRDYAKFFAAEGAQVAATDVLTDGVKETAELISKEGGRAIAVQVDVADPSSTEELARRVHAEFGRIDILINNAGIWGDLEMSPAIETDPDYWDLVMAVNLKGPLLCARAVAPFMKENKWGRIINISSMGAYMPGGVYSISKFALNHLTWELAKELGDFGITVNGVAPGCIDNEATQGRVSDEGMKALVQGAIVKRAGSGKDLYGMIRYLVSDDAEWVTAQTILVNGGYNVNL